MPLHSRKYLAFSSRSSPPESSNRGPFFGYRNIQIYFKELTAADCDNHNQLLAAGRRRSNPGDDFY
jgi:hypothetical protein